MLRSSSLRLPLSGCGARAGGQHSAQAAAHQRSGTGADPERSQAHGHAGAGARPGGHQPAMELTKQAGRTLIQSCCPHADCCFKDDFRIHRLTLYSKD